MFINLKVLDAESAMYYGTEAVLMGDGYLVYNDKGHLTMVGIEEDEIEREAKRMSELFEQDPSIIDRMSEMAAQDYLELCE